MTLLSKKIDPAQKDDFYTAKFFYFRKLSTYIVIVSALASLSYWVSDCQLFGRVAYETIISRFSILLVLALFIILGRMKKIKDNYKVQTILSYAVSHSIMWCTIWSIWYLPDRTHANEGFIIIQVIFIMMGLCAPRQYSLIMHSLVIVNIIVSNTFNHYENFDLMITLGLPLLVGTEIVIYYIEEVFADKYIMDLELKFLTVHDQLTGVYNRNKLYDMCEKDTNRLNVESSSVFIMIMDIDYFKKINDTYGHDVGDQVLKTLADTIRSQIRSTDTLIRWGGEEFIIILPDTTPEGCRQIAERIRKAVETGDSAPKITVSIGLTKYDNDDYHASIKRADVALYKAKESGRNRIEVA